MMSRRSNTYMYLTKVFTGSFGTTINNSLWDRFSDIRATSDTPFHQNSGSLPEVNSTTSLCNSWIREFVWNDTLFSWNSECRCIPLLPQSGDTGGISHSQHTPSVMSHWSLDGYLPPLWLPLNWWCHLLNCTTIIDFFVDTTSSFISFNLLLPLYIFLWLHCSL